jgi:nucleoredoxin
MNSKLSCMLLGMLFTLTSFGQPAVVGAHSQDLVVLRDDKLVALEPSKLAAAPYTVLYFGAGWCPDCRKFSPALVEAYDHQLGSKKRFEVLFLTKDKSADGMLKFMQKEKMQWPAVAYDKMASADDLNKYYSGHGIPCLTVLDPKGTVVLQTKSDQDAREVLQQLEDLLKEKS